MVRNKQAPSPSTKLCLPNKAALKVVYPVYEVMTLAPKAYKMGGSRMPLISRSLPIGRNKLQWCSAIQSYLTSPVSGEAT